MTVDEAIQAALTTSSAYTDALADEQIAALEAKNATTRLLPAVGADAELVFNSAGAGTGVQSFVSENSVQWYRGTVGLSGSIFGGLLASATEERARLAAAHAGSEGARRALIGATVEAYFGLALAEAQVSAAEDNVASAADLARITGLRFAAGEVPEVDVLRTRMIAAGRQDELAQATLGRTVAEAALAVLLGRDGEVEVTPLASTSIPVSPSDSAKMAAADPAVTEARAEADAARAGVTATRAEWLPSIGYAFGYGVDTDTLGSELASHVGVVGSVNLHVPVFDWGLGARSVDQAKIEVYRAEAAVAQAQRVAAAELALAEATAASAEARASALEAVLPDATRNAEISLARYQAGEADLVELDEARQSLVDARFAANSARADCLVARAQLHTLVGE